MSLNLHPSESLERELMGVVPRPVSLGTEHMGTKRNKLCVCLVGASVVILAAILITLTCCVVKCQGQLKTSDLDEKLANLEEDKGALEKQRDGARAEVTALRSELAGTNQTLWELRGRWDSCRSLTVGALNSAQEPQSRVRVAQCWGLCKGAGPCPGKFTA